MHDLHPKQGDIYYLELPDGGGHHYAIIAPQTQFNTMNSVLVLPFTTKRIEQRSASGTAVVFEIGSHHFLTQRSVVPVEGMRWVSTAILGEHPVASLSQNDMNRVLAAIATFFGIPTYMDIDE